MPKTPHKVPEPMQSLYDAITALTDALCAEYLTDEYKELARQMAAALARKRPPPIARGRTHTWACGIIYALGQVNFLFDSSQDPHMRADELCQYFGVSKSTGGNKAKAIRDALKMNIFDPKWSLPSQLATHPTAWMIMVDGIIIDARHAPLEIQRLAFRKGLIPYVYAERSRDKGA